MNRKSKNITKTVAIVASALVLGVAGLFADQITTTIFNKYFQLGPADALRIDESVVVRPAQLGKELQRLDIRAVGREAVPYRTRLARPQKSAS